MKKGYKGKKGKSRPKVPSRQKHKIFPGKLTGIPAGKKAYPYNGMNSQESIKPESLHWQEPKSGIKLTEVPLNKYIAYCGLCSRRQAAILVKEGKVKVNGLFVMEPAKRVTGTELIELEGKKLTPKQKLVYVLLNKPKGFLTTTKDPEGRRTVMDLVREASDERLFPVGRLDRNTSGLLLLTNDGDLAQRLSHPSNEIKKVYQAGLDKELSRKDFESIQQGISLEDGFARVDVAGYPDPKDKSIVGLEIHSGKNRIVRRIFEHLGYKVEKLDRVMFAGLTKKNLPRGKWRLLDEKEVIFLKHFK